MNRSRRRVSTAYTLAITLIVGLMSVFFLAPVHAFSSVPPAERFVSEPASDLSALDPQSDAPADPAENSAEQIAVENEDGEPAAPTTENPAQPPSEEPPAPPAPADEGAGGGSDPIAPPSDPGTQEPAPVAPTEEPGTGSEEPGGNNSDNGGSNGDGSGEEPGGTGDEGSDPGGSGEDDLAGTDGNPVPNNGITLHPAPGTLPQAKVGETYSARLTADGGAGGAYSYKVIGAELLPLPAGLALERSSGVLSGVPNAVGKYSFTVEVSTEGDAAPIRQAYSIRVQGVSLGISVPGGTEAAVQTAQVGKPFALRFATSGGAGPYSYSIGGAQLSDTRALQRPDGSAAHRSVERRPSALSGPEVSAPVSVRRADGMAAGGTAVGNLPAPLKLDRSGSLQGIPQTAGTYQFTVVSTDRYGSSASKDFTLTILGVGEQAAPRPGNAVEPLPAPSAPPSDTSASGSAEDSGLSAPGAKAASEQGASEQAPVPPEAQLAEGLESEVASIPLANTGASLGLLFGGLAILVVGTALLLWQGLRRRGPQPH